MTRFLGKLPAQFDSSLPLAKTFKLLAPVKLPESVDWSLPVSAVPILGNDVCGDCAIATSLHAVQFMTANSGSMQLPTTSCAIQDYSELTGYNPVTKANDTGLVLLTKNQFWMKTGFTVNDGTDIDKLDGFAQIEAGDIDSLMKALALFGPTELGLELPPDAEDAYEDAHTWVDTSGAVGGLGGHDTLIVGYYDQGAWFKIATWDGYVTASRAWISKYMSEGTALLKRKWLNPSGISPSNLDWRQLDDLITEQHGVLADAA
jgi:hypothetical protein